MSKQSPPDVYGYLDFRAFLRDLYAEKKEKNKSFSYRSFSRRAGVSSPNYLKLVVEGERNLSAKMAERFAEACGLDADAGRYFVHLVAVNQAKTSSDRALHYGKLTSFRQYRQAHKLELAHAAYYSEWYIPAIRELAASREFRADPEWIADQLLPSITPLQAERALETLLELGLLVRAEQGRLEQADALLSTGPETRGLHIVAFHRAMTQRALEAHRSRARAGAGHFVAHAVFEPRRSQNVQRTPAAGTARATRAIGPRERSRAGGTDQFPAFSPEPR